MNPNKIKKDFPIFKNNEKLFKSLEEDENVDPEMEYAEPEGNESNLETPGSIEADAEGLSTMEEEPEFEEEA